MPITPTRHAYASHASQSFSRSEVSEVRHKRQRLSAESSDRSRSAISAAARASPPPPPPSLAFGCRRYRAARVRLSPPPFVQRPSNARLRRNARPTPCFICALRRSRSLVLLASRRRVARFRTSRLVNAKRPQQSRVTARQVRACLPSQSGAGYRVNTFCAWLQEDHPQRASPSFSE